MGHSSAVVIIYLSTVVFFYVQIIHKSPLRGERVEEEEEKRGNVKWHFLERGTIPTHLGARPADHTIIPQGISEPSLRHMLLSVTSVCYKY